MSNHISVRKSNPDSTEVVKKSKIVPWQAVVAGAALGVLLAPATSHMGKSRARKIKVAAGVGGAVTGLVVTALYNARCP